MRILVHEFVSGGGLAGRDVVASLVREGAAMRDALVADLARIPGHRIVTTADPRFPIAAPPAVEVVMLPAHQGHLFDALIESADAVWLIAPETNRCLERLAAKAERARKMLLGPSADVILRASDKGGLAKRLTRHGIAHPLTRIVRREADLKRAAREIGFPLVVKPRRGAGCDGVCLARSSRELGHLVAMARRAARGGVLLQEYVDGVAASVSLLADGRRAVALALNAQQVRPSRPFSYRGGRTPLNHPLAQRAIDAAVDTCQLLAGLRGYVGVDLVLTPSDAVVIEVNPRLTTAYLGVRAALAGTAGNVAAMALAACAGVLPTPPALRRSVRFTAAGRVVTR